MHPLLIPPSARSHPWYPTLQRWQGHGLPLYPLPFWPTNIKLDSFAQLPYDPTQGQLLHLCLGVWCLLTKVERINPKWLRISSFYVGLLLAVTSSDLGVDYPWCPPKMEDLSETLLYLFKGFFSAISGCIPWFFWCMWAIFDGCFEMFLWPWFSTVDWTPFHCVL